MNAPLDHLEALERALVAKSFPAMTEWWKRTLATFFASKKKQCVLRVGRRGGKSSTLCRLAVLLALFGEWTITPGDVGIIGFVSVSRDEAAQRIRMIKAILDALKVEWKPIDGGIELERKPIAFKVFTASVSGVVGGSWLAFFGDELARWRDADSGSNPAKQVLESARPTMAGQPNAITILSSSARGSTDTHAKLIDAGDTAFQMVATATTWEARPELTEADCRALEPDELVFKMEYGSIPYDGSESSLMAEADLLAATRKGTRSLPRSDGAYIATMDPATRSNGWTLVIGCERVIDEDPSLSFIEVTHCQEWRAPRGGALDSDETLVAIGAVLAAYGLTEVWSDQWGSDPLVTLASHHGIELLQQPSTQASKVITFDALKRRVVDRTIELPDDPIVRADLLGVRKWISRNGAFSIELERQGGRHSDFAPSIALLVNKVASAALPEWVAAMEKMRARETAEVAAKVAANNPNPSGVCGCRPGLFTIDPRHLGCAGCGYARAS